MGKQKLEEISEELMSTKETIIHPVKICNKLGNIKAPQVECTIRMRNYLIKTNALLDIGCTHVIIDEKIIPNDFIILAKMPMVAQQVDGSFNHYKNQLEAGAKILFMTNCYSSPEYSLLKDETWIKPLSLRHKVILGLSFLLKDNRQVTFSKDFFSLSRHSIISPLKIGEEITSTELEKQIKHFQKRKINKEECKCKEGECSLQNETLEAKEID